MSAWQLRLTPLVIGALVASCDSGQQPTSPSDHYGSIAAKVDQASAPLLAHMQFGIDEHSSPFPPPDEHDGSGHARDHVYPREVVIARGGQVAFHIDPVHQVAVYEPGTEPGDIRVDPTTLEDVDLGPFVLPNFRINDPTNRIVLGPPQQLFDQDWTTPSGTFDQPGRYLVICTTTPHFLASKMYGWVTVK
jgi:plastocyanin